ncbi:MAG: aldo/keto reductase [Clostridia bacterium]|nr:aldo/keto reductase [Clostridia bacterium]
MHIHPARKQPSSLQDTWTLHNGVAVPVLGLGTYKSLGDSALYAVSEALQFGYRHVDTAAYYGNEAEVGEGIRRSGVPREDVFVTTKVWNTHRAYGQVLASCDESLRKLQIDYIDLLLIHWPANALSYGDRAPDLNRDMWRAFEDLYADGKVRAIGVSNFLPHHLQQILDTARVVPMVDQIEIHPGWLQKETVDFCQGQNILVEAWSPMARQAVTDNPVLQELASQYGRTPAQICLRWELQHGIVPLPKTTRRERMAENADVFDFTLTDEEVAAVDALKDAGGKCAVVDETET